MLTCVLAQMALPLAARRLGRKPPSKNPHVTCCAVKRSPMFRPVMITTSLEAQSSNAPSGSPISTPSRTSSKWLDTVPKGNRTAVEPVGTVTCDLLPDTRLLAPSVDGLNVVPNELSNSVKCWASFHG